MITTIHLLTGAALGKHVRSIGLIIVLAILSHYVLDVIPHWSPLQVEGFKEGGIKGMDINDFLLKSIEPIAGVILILILAKYNRKYALPMLLGAFFAWFPDLINLIAWKYDLLTLRQFVPYPGGNFYNLRRDLVGIITSMGVGIIAIFFLIKSPEKTHKTKDKISH